MLNINKVIKMIDDLGQFGKTAANGVTRVTYSKEYREAASYLENYMKNIGLETYVDSVGNLFGTYLGKNHSLPKVLTG